MKRTVQRDGPDPIDVAVGRKVRERRIGVGLSQTALAGQVGISFQQLQKNEQGQNRISASRLWRLAEALDVPVAYFFIDCGRQAPTPEGDRMLTRETLELVRNYHAIQGSHQRGAVYGLVKALARQDEPRAVRVAAE